MGEDWHSWCRLCATETNGISIADRAFPEFDLGTLISKYIFILVRNDDKLPQTICTGCWRQIAAFDRFARHCQDVQTLFGKILEQTPGNSSNAERLRSQFFEDDDTDSNCTEVQGMNVLDMLSVDHNCPDVEETESPGVEEPEVTGVTKRKKFKLKPLRLRLPKVKVEDRERRSSRLQVLAQTQIDFGMDSASFNKNGPDNVEHVEVKLPKKRGRPPKQIASDPKILVGAAKRKTKTPRVVKSKKLALPEENAIEGQRVDPKPREEKKMKQPCFFRFECHVCGALSQNWNSLSLHTKRVHDESAQVMCLCAKILSSRATIVKHRLSHTVGYKYRCDKCIKTFHRRGSYELHLLSHVPKEEQPFVCCKCARRFHCESLLRQHEKVHLPKEERLIYPCSTCQKKFSSKSAVSAHIKSIHFGERPFVCDQCGHSFTSKGILQEHLTIHSDETPFECPHCQKAFKTKYRLKIHLDIHRETPYPCPHCPLKLSTRRTLRMHLVVHKDTKAFQCSTCGKDFRRAKDLKNHHNLHTGLRPYTCTFCPRTFANGSNCRSHKRRMHPEELRAYEAGLADNQTNGPSNGTSDSLANGTSDSLANGTSDSLANGTSDSVANGTSDSLANGHSTRQLSNPTSSPPLVRVHVATIPLEVSAPPKLPQRQPDFTVTESELIMNVPSTSNRQANVSGQEYRRFSESSMKNTQAPSASRAAMTVTTSYQNSQMPQQNPNAIVSRISNSNNSSMSRNHYTSARSSHQYVTMNEGNNDCSVNQGMNTPRRGHVGNNDRNIATHVPNTSPLNLNVSEIHLNRQHPMNAGINMMGNDSHFLNQRSSVSNISQGHMSNLHHVRHNNLTFNLNRPPGDRVIAISNRTGREVEANPSMNRDLELNQIHHNAGNHSNILQGYGSSVSPIYQHPGTVMAHSGTVGVPAFPGNPYSQGMGSSLANYQQRNGNM